MTNWDDLRVFLALSRHGSHASAARALDVDPTTVGRRMTALEETLGARLFRRTTKGLALTDEGAKLAENAERIEQEVLASERALSGAGRALEGTVRVTSGDGIITYVLVPALGALLTRHPGLRVELRGGLGTLDLSRREADVALRFSRPKEASLVARRVGVARFALFASESYLARRGRPTSEDALASHDFIGYEGSLDVTPPMAWLLRRTRGEVRIRASTTATMVAACAAGLGIAILTTTAVRNHPELVQVLPRAEIPSRDVWSVVHADVRRHPRVAAVLEWAASALAAAGMAVSPRASYP